MPETEYTVQNKKKATHVAFIFYIWIFVNEAVCLMKAFRKDFERDFSLLAYLNVSLMITKTASRERKNL